MADIWDRIGIKPPELDPKKVKLILEEQPKDAAQPQPQQQQRYNLPNNIYTQDGFIPDFLRTIGDTGLNYGNLIAQGINAVGGDIDRSGMIETIAKLRQAQDESDARTLSPTRKAEEDKIKAEMERANGIVDNVIAGGKMGADMLLHPIDNAGKIVGGLVDPLNVFGFGAGKVATKATIDTLGRVGRVGAGATAGAVTNAPVNAAQEGLFANARGEDWEKSAAAGFGGGLVGGAMLGGLHPAFSKNPSSMIDPNAPEKMAMESGINMNGTPREARMGADGTYRGFNYPMAQDGGIDIDATVKQIASQRLLGWMDAREMNLRTEAAQVQEQISALLSQGSDAKTIQTTLDNLITPSRDDVMITNLLNNNAPLPSRMSGVRLIPLLENSIKTAQEAPQIARTNQEFYDVMVSSGASKDLANVMTSAYAAKDPQILRDHIYQTLSQNAPALIDHNAIREDVSTQVAGMMADNGVPDRELQRELVSLWSKNYDDPKEELNAISRIQEIESILSDNGYSADQIGAFANMMSEADYKQRLKAGIPKRVLNGKIEYTNETLSNDSETIVKDSKTIVDAPRTTIEKGDYVVSNNRIKPVEDINEDGYAVLREPEYRMGTSVIIKGKTHTPIDGLKRYDGEIDDTYMGMLQQIDDAEREIRLADRQKNEGIIDGKESAKIKRLQNKVIDEVEKQIFDYLKPKTLAPHIRNNSDTISNNSETIVKGGEDEKVQPVRGDDGARSETERGAAVRPDKGGSTSGNVDPVDGGVGGAPKSTGDAVGELRPAQPNTRNGSGDDAVSQRAEPVERQPATQRNDSNDAGAGDDAVVRVGDGSNFELTGKAPILLTKGERKKINEQAKEILKRGAPYSDADKEILRQYTGEGGLESSKASLTQHYTPYQTIEAMYNAIDAAGFKPKTALEPAVGSGNFVGFRPDLKWTTIDIDKTNHDVVNALYPQAKNYHNGFEEFKGKGFDLIISNVPFLEERGAGGLKDRTDIKMLHDYYFAAAMDKVNDNGIVAFVTSKGTMDKADSTVRREIVSKGDIIGAYRLPSGTFAKNTHTDVITDVIFIQKRPEGVEPRESVRADNEAFITSSKSADDIYMNDYYQLHTANILGDIKAGIDRAYGRPAYEITGTPDYSRMKIDYVPYGKEKAAAKTADTDMIPTDSKEFDKWAVDNGIEVTRHDSGGIVIDGNKVMIRKTVEMSDINSKWYIYEPMSDIMMAEKIKHLDAIREAGENRDLKRGTWLIDQYKSIYKAHPKKDKALGKALRSVGEDQKYYEYGSFFNDKFEPSDIFSEQTRYTGGGKNSVTTSSPLKERMFHEENNEGIVDIKKSELIDPKEFAKILKDDTYAYLGGDRFQNAILYYSGNIYDRIDAVNALRETHIDDEAITAKLDKQLQELNAIMPEPKKVDEIAFKGVEKWISDAGIPIPFKKIEKTEKLAGGGTKTTTEWSSTYGKVFDNYLNGKQLINMKDEESMSSFKNRLREAQQEIMNVLDKYRGWLGREGHTEAFEKAYNKRYNGYVQPDYLKASYLIQETLDALPADLSLRSNQIQWIMQAYYEGKGINAHDVGGGKTLAGVVLAKVLKDKGVAKKPIFVVPSKVIKNWVKEIKRAVPDAKIVDLGNLPKEKRESMLYELANTNADYVLISKEGFETLKLPKEVERRYADQLLRENLRNDQLKGRALEVMNEKIEKFLAAIDAENKNQSITIDKLGIDAIIADEARSYKNIGVSSELVGNKLGKAFGLNFNDKTGAVSIDSNTAYDFRFKTRYISERNNGKNVFLLDATPTPNKPIEIFTMLKHLDNGIFDEYGIETDRDFANMFFEFGLKPTKTGSMEKGLIALKNAFGLKAIMNRYINRISMNDFAAQKIIDLPEEKVINHYLDQTDEGDIVFDEISRRMAEAKADREKRKEMPGIFSNGITASVDPRLYQRMGINEILDPTPDNHKIEKVVSLVLERRGENKRAGQIIFLDSAGHTASSITEVKDRSGIVTEIYPATLDKNLHQEIKEKLIASGKYKASEIAILSGQEITDPRTGKETKATGNKAQQLKQDIVNAYDDGKIKVIIGTTKSAGEGMNIQKFTTDIYHVDLPWTIAEVIQRNGRGVRYGNENSSVNTHYFFQAGTFDSLMYKTVMNKKGWNEALWDSKVEDRMEVVDEGGSMPSPAEIMLAMEKDPIKRRKLELEIEHQRLSDEYNNVIDESNAINRRIKVIEQEVRDEMGKQRDLEERMKDPTPTKELKELYEKALKDPKKYQEKFDEVQARVKKSQENMHAQRVEKIARLTKEKETRAESLRKTNEILNTVTHDLHLFEDKYMDNRGNFITELESGC